VSRPPQTMRDRPLALILRRTKWPGPTAGWSYEVFDGGSQIGRIQLVEGEERWVWSLRPFTSRVGYQQGGVAKTLHEAQATLEAAWEAADKR
jgi:hypothetical protein